ncbi:hypothetical protein BKA70DRAFT_1300283 [Coprinopsis sp. MPI-PUGE-AT-0042]|nr:hypothetical protein BKA70DRAFT_1300283 [Coprinopsis sp. MPI-PUGE-AT-0042]
MSSTSPPIHRLAPEILVQIFQCLHSTQDQAIDYHGWDGRSDEAILERALAPYSVSGVCKYWDEVSTLFPEMWNQLRILVSLDSFEGGSPAQITEKCLQRAPHSDTFVFAALLPVLSRHIHRISELSIHTRFATSLPPFSFLSPSPDGAMTLLKLTVNAQESKRPKHSPLPPWPTGPPIQHVPLLGDWDVSGLTFTSYCVSEANPRPASYQDRTELRILNLTRVNAETVAALLSLGRRRYFYGQEMTLNDCLLPVPVPIEPDAMDVEKLVINSCKTPSIINILHAINAGCLIFQSGCDIGDGVELFHHLETMRRCNGTSLVEKTSTIRIFGHGYMPLALICRFVEAKLGHCGPKYTAKSLPILELEPTLADWEKMKADAPDRSVIPRIDEVGGGSIMAWETSGEPFYLVAHDAHSPDQPTERIIVQIVQW